VHTTHCAEVRGIQIYDRSLELVLARDALTRSTRAGSTFEHRLVSCVLRQYPSMQRSFPFLSLSFLFLFFTSQTCA